MGGANSDVRDKQLVSNSSSAGRGVRNIGGAETTLETQKRSSSNANNVVREKSMSKGRDNNNNVRGNAENATRRSKGKREKILGNVLRSVKRNVKGRNMIRDNNNVKSNAENATSKSKKESTTGKVAQSGDKINHKGKGRKSLNRVIEIIHTTSTHEGFSQSSEASKVISVFLRGLLRGLNYFVASRTTEWP